MCSVPCLKQLDSYQKVSKVFSTYFILLEYIFYKLSD